MSGCVSLGATAIMLTVIYFMVRAFTAPKTGGNGAAGAPGAGGAGASQSWGTDPKTGRQITVQVKGDSQWQWATISVPMAKSMPAGLIVGVRPSPRIALAPGAQDERAFYALADAMGKNPERVTEWAISENRNAVLDAYWKLQQGFQIRGTTLSANVPVSGTQDPQIQRSVYILAELAQRLSMVVDHSSAYNATHTTREEEHLTFGENADDVEGDEDEEHLATAHSPAPGSTESESTPVSPASSPAWSTPAAGGGLPSATSSPFTATQAQAASPSPFASGQAQDTAPSPSPFASTQAQSAAPSPFTQGAASPPSASPSPFAATTSPFAVAAMPGAFSSLSPTSSPVDVTTSAQSSLEDLPQGAGSASDLLSAMVKQSSSEAQERFVAESWAGRLVGGEGKVAFTSTIFGRDSELDVSGGSKVTVEVPVEGAGVLAPKVLIHLPEAPPQGVTGFGKTVRFVGEVKGYRSLGRNLLLLNGRLL